MSNEEAKTNAAGGQSALTAGLGGKVSAALTKIAQGNLEQPELYWLSREILESGDLDKNTAQFFSEVRDSTKHAAVLGCGYPLDYDLLRKDALALLTPNGEGKPRRTGAE